LKSSAENLKLLAKIENFRRKFKFSAELWAFSWKFEKVAGKLILSLEIGNFR
jgi:hypothetical protein